MGSFIWVVKLPLKDMKEFTFSLGEADWQKQMSTILTPVLKVSSIFCFCGSEFRLHSGLSPLVDLACLTLPGTILF